MGIQLIFIIILMLICFTVELKAAKNRSNGRAKNKKLSMPHINMGERLRNSNKEHELCKAATVKSYKIGTLGLEDRENDWLARQLKEEAKLKKKIFSE